MAISLVPELSPWEALFEGLLRGLPYQQVPHLCFSSPPYEIVLVLINDLQSCTNVSQMVAAVNKAFGCLGGFYVYLHVLYTRQQDPLSNRWESLMTRSEMEARDAGSALALSMRPYSPKYLPWTLSTNLCVMITIPLSVKLGQWRFDMHT